MGHLGGINKVAWGAKLLPTSISARAMVWAHCDCFCQLLNKQLGCLGLMIPGLTHPPSHHPLPPTTTLIHDTCDITESFPISISCQLCNASYKTSYNQANELQCLEYFKLGFLEIQNVTIRSVFLTFRPALCIFRVVSA